MLRMRSGGLIRLGSKIDLTLTWLWLFKKIDSEITRLIVSYYSLSNQLRKKNNLLFSATRGYFNFRFGTSAFYAWTGHRNHRFGINATFGHFDRWGRTWKSLWFSLCYRWAFINHVDKILPIIDHLPTHCWNLWKNFFTEKRVNLHTVDISSRTVYTLSPTSRG